MVVDIKSVIENFSGYGFDDFGHSKSYKIKLFKNWKQDNNLSDNDILKIVNDELNELLISIHKNKENNFLSLPEQFDYKYGHWNVLHWIIGRWYIDANTIEDVPKWYQYIINITNYKQEKEIRQVENIIN